MTSLLRDLVQAAGVLAVVAGAGLAFGGLGLMVSGLAVAVAVEVTDR